MWKRVFFRWSRGLGQQQPHSSWAVVTQSLPHGGVVGGRAVGTADTTTRRERSSRSSRSSTRWQGVTVLNTPTASQASTGAPNGRRSVWDGQRMMVHSAATQRGGETEYVPTAPHFCRMHPFPLLRCHPHGRTACMVYTACVCAWLWLGGSSYTPISHLLTCILVLCGVGGAVRVCCVG
jgi:hypothetical protein